jgi:hypothetical protein
MFGFFLMATLIMLSVSAALIGNMNILPNALASGKHSDKNYKYQEDEKSYYSDEGDNKYSPDYSYYQYDQPMQQQEEKSGYDYNNNYGYDKGYDRSYENNGYDKGYNYGKDKDYDGGGGYEYDKQVFVAKLNGENVKPNSTDSPINGFAKVKVAEKPYSGEKRLIYELSVFDVPKGDDLIAAHIHVINDPQTQLGPHIITLCGQPINENRCTEGPGVIAKGIATNEDIETEEQDIITNIDELIDALEEGRGYIQIHSTQFPEGAVRGDLIEK